jgi:hypothetical protein
VKDLYYITYELERPVQEHPGFLEAIERLGPTLQTLENGWFVVSEEPAGIIMDLVRPHVGPTDKLVIIQIKGDNAWNLRDELSEWLTETINSSWIPDKD